MQTLHWLASKHQQLQVSIPTAMPMASLKVCGRLNQTAAAAPAASLWDPEHPQRRLAAQQAGNSTVQAGDNLALVAGQSSTLLGSKRATPERTGVEEGANEQVNKRARSCAPALVTVGTAPTPSTSHLFDDSICQPSQAPPGPSTAVNALLTGAGSSVAATEAPKAPKALPAVAGAASVELGKQPLRESMAVNAMYPTTSVPGLRHSTGPPIHLLHPNPHQAYQLAAANLTVALLEQYQQYQPQQYQQQEQQQQQQQQAAYQPVTSHVAVTVNPIPADLLQTTASGGILAPHLNAAVTQQLSQPTSLPLLQTTAATKPAAGQHAAINSQTQERSNTAEPSNATCSAPPPVFDSTHHIGAVLEAQQRPVGPRALGSQVTADAHTQHVAAVTTGMDVCAHQAKSMTQAQVKQVLQQPEERVAALAAEQASGDAAAADVSPIETQAVVPVNLAAKHAAIPASVPTAFPACKPEALPAGIPTAGPALALNTQPFTAQPPHGSPEKYVAAGQGILTELHSPAAQHVSVSPSLPLAAAGLTGSASDWVLSSPKWMDAFFTSPQHVPFATPGHRPLRQQARQQSMQYNGSQPVQYSAVQSMQHPNAWPLWDENSPPAAPMGFTVSGTPDNAFNPVRKCGSVKQPKRCSGAGAVHVACTVQELDCGAAFGHCDSQKKPAPCGLREAKANAFVSPVPAGKRPQASAIWTQTPAVTCSTAAADSSAGMAAVQPCFHQHGGTGSGTVSAAPEEAFFKQSLDMTVTAAATTELEKPDTSDEPAQITSRSFGRTAGGSVLAKRPWSDERITLPHDLTITVATTAEDQGSPATLSGGSGADMTRASTVEAVWVCVPQDTSVPASVPQLPAATLPTVPSLAAVAEAAARATALPLPSSPPALAPSSAVAAGADTAVPAGCQAAVDTLAAVVPARQLGIASKAFPCTAHAMVPVVQRMPTVLSAVEQTVETRLPAKRARNAKAQTAVNPAKRGFPNTKRPAAHHQHISRRSSRSTAVKPSSKNISTDQQQQQQQQQQGMLCQPHTELQMRQDTSATPNVHLQSGLQHPLASSPVTLAAFEPDTSFTPFSPLPALVSPPAVPRSETMFGLPYLNDALIKSPVLIASDCPLSAPHSYQQPLSVKPPGAQKAVPASPARTQPLAGCDHTVTIDMPVRSTHTACLPAMPGPEADSSAHATAARSAAQAGKPEASIAAVQTSKGDVSLVPVPGQATTPAPAARTANAAVTDIAQCAGPTVGNTEVSHAKADSAKLHKTMTSGLEGVIVSGMGPTADPKVVQLAKKLCLDNTAAPMCLDSTVARTCNDSTAAQTAFDATPLYSTKQRATPAAATHVQANAASKQRPTHPTPPMFNTAINYQAASSTMAATTIPAAPPTDRFIHTIAKTVFKSVDTIRPPLSTGAAVTTGPFGHGCVTTNKYTPAGGNTDTV